jgi:GNAT superfamily N-acetyltransferase
MGHRLKSATSRHYFPMRLSCAPDLIQDSHVKSEHPQMSVDEFELLPMRPGWKYEYWDGRAHITPRELGVIVAMPVTARSVNTSLVLRKVTRDDAAELTSAFLEAFVDSVEYCDWETEKISDAADKAIRSHFSSERGKPHSASRVAMGFDRELGCDSIVGAAMLAQAPRYSILDLLFVRPAWQRHGIARALLSDAMNELHSGGEAILKSAYHAANEVSMDWHHRFGFVEEPDLMRARLYSSAARHELWRREKIGGLSDRKRGELQIEADRWKTEVEQLKEIGDREGYKAVAPILTWRD